jgi:acetyltransferase-like isoleucine patch superfamily enzyme
VFFCFKNLPFKQALKLPIKFYNDAYCDISKYGKIILTDDFIKNNCKILIGQKVKDFDYQCEKTYLNIMGTLIFKGNFKSLRGANIDVRGILEFDDDVLVGPRVRIRAHNSIKIGRNARIAHEVQMFDTNFHFTEDPSSPGFKNISKPIEIGNYCWIGNRTTISAGVTLPDYTIVGSNSLVNKDFSKLEKFSLIAGVPAKHIKTGISRVWDTERELSYFLKEFKWYRRLMGVSDEIV